MAKIRDKILNGVRNTVIASTAISPLVRAADLEESSFPDSSEIQIAADPPSFLETSEFGRLIGETKGAGIDVEYTAGIRIPLDFNLLENRLLFRAGIDLKFNRASANFLQSEAYKKELPENLIKSAPARVFAFELESDRSEAGGIKVAVSDVFSGEVVYSLELSPSTGGEFLDQAEQLTGDLIAIIQGKTAEHTAILESLPALTSGRPVIKVAQESLSPQDQQKLSELFEQGYRIRLEIKESSEHFEFTPTVVFDQQLFAALGNKQILIDGQIKQIVVERSADRVAEVKTLEFVDDFSNRVIYFSDAEKDISTVYTYPRSPFQTLDGEVGGYSPTPFTIPSPADGLEAQTLDQVFLTAKMSPKALAGLVPVYADRDYYLAHSKDKLAEVAKGIDRVKSAFGLGSEDSLVEQVYLAQSLDKNAFFNSANPGAITFLDQLFEDDVDLSLIATHETLHLVDHNEGDDLSANFNFQVLFSELKNLNPQFLLDINESTFFSEQGIGGHANDSPGEFFASLLNTVLADDWQQRVDSYADWSPTDLTQREFKTLYDKTLQSLQEVFADGDISEDAPITLIIHRQRLHLGRANE